MHSPLPSFQNEKLLIHLRLQRRLSRPFSPICALRICYSKMKSKTEKKVYVWSREWFEQQKGHKRDFPRVQKFMLTERASWPWRKTVRCSWRKATKKLLCVKTFIPLIIMHWNEGCRTVLQQRTGASCTVGTQLQAIVNSESYVYLCYYTTSNYDFPKS